MISRVKISNFRCLKEFDWVPSHGINLLVGNNGAGKSTILDAIEIALTGHINGQRVQDALSPHWFNEEVHDDYLRRARNGENPGIPSIAIEIFFSDDCSPEINKTRGLKNSETCDSAGLSYEIAIKRELLSEFLAVIKDEETDLIPTEYFKCTWTMFSGTEIYRRPEGISCNRLEADGVGSDRRSSQRNRTMLESLISDSDLRAVSAKQRQMRREIDKEVLKKTTGQVSSGEHLANVGFQMDQSPRSDWRNSITLGLNNRPIQFEGHGMQILVKSHLALDSAMGQNVLLLEEPESHLSHTSLMQLLSSICERLGDRQAFITTHSTFVLNRLGIDKLSLIAPKSKPIRLSDLSIDTVRYFQKQSGYDTLRICLATKLVLVEGPTDEMIFNWAYEKEYGVEPLHDGIDVMTYGTRGKRALELAAKLGREHVAVLRDNDGKDPSHWISAVEDFLSEGRRMFVGEVSSGSTIEPQFLSANEEMNCELSELFDLDDSDYDALLSYMSNNKTDWAWRIISANSEKLSELSCPEYIANAIEFIHG